MVKLVLERGPGLHGIQGGLVERALGWWKRKVSLTARQRFHGPSKSRVHPDGRRTAFPPVVWPCPPVPHPRGPRDTRTRWTDKKSSVKLWSWALSVRHNPLRCLMGTQQVLIETDGRLTCAASFFLP